MNKEHKKNSTDRKDLNKKKKIQRSSTYIDNPYEFPCCWINHAANLYLLSHLELLHHHIKKILVKTNIDILYTKKRQFQTLN